MCRQAEQVWATSQRPWSARPVARKYTIYSRKRSEQAWRKSEWAGRWDSGSRERGPGGKVHCSAGLPGQTSCRQISIGSVSWYKLSMIPCQAQRTSMSGGRARHLLASLLWKRLFRTSPQQLPKGSGWWSLSLAPWPGAKGNCWELRLSHQPSKYHHVSKKAISFIKAGEKPRARPH